MNVRWVDRMIRLNDAMVNVDGFYELLEKQEAESIEVRAIRTDKKTIMFEIKLKDKNEYYLIESEIYMEVIASAIRATIAAIPK